MKFYLFIFSVLVSFSLCSSGEVKITEGKKKLPMEGESFRMNGYDAFIILPKDVSKNTPWVWYAPTLEVLPSVSEVWMFRRFLAKGIAIVGVDVGESFGNVAGRKVFSDFYDYLVSERDFSKKPCLLARSRGGLMLYTWASENPKKVSGVGAIYPVCNLLSYPGVAKAAKAYGLGEDEFMKVVKLHNPIDLLVPIAKEGVPIFHLHGDSDRVVPYEKNTQLLAARYRKLGGSVEVQLSKGQGHNMWDGWFKSGRLSDFIIKRALAGAVTSKGGK